MVKFQITLLGASRTQTLRGDTGVRNLEVKCQVAQRAADWNSGDQDAASSQRSHPL